MRKKNVSERKTSIIKHNELKIHSALEENGLSKRLLLVTFVQYNSHETSATNDRNIKFRCQYNNRGVRFFLHVCVKILHSA